MEWKDIPVLGDIDLKDPDKRKQSIKILAAGVGIIVVLIMMILSKRSEAQAAQAEEAAAASASNYESVAIEPGKDRESLSGKTIRDVSAKRGVAGGFARDIFDSQEAQDDPLAALSGETGEGTPSSQSLSRGSSSEESSGFPPEPEFIRKNKNVYPEGRSSASGQRTAAGSAARSAASAAVSESSQQAATSRQETAEERRRRIYLEYGIDPETKEPIRGSSGYQGAGASTSSKESAQSDAASQPTAKPQNDSEPAAVPEPKVQVRRSGGVSSFGMSGASAGTSIASLGDQDIYVADDPAHPFKVKFAYDEKVKSGQRVTIRLCEDMVVDGVLIPVNTHLHATCSVGERLDLTVTSIDIGGKLYTLNYTAYDNDGGKGLYCPESGVTKAAKEIGGDATQIAEQALSSAITGYPGRILNSGARIFSSKRGEKSVHVTAGYTFYLMRAEK